MLKVARAALLWLVSEACQTSTSTWVTLEWLHILLTSRQLAVCNSPHNELMSLARHLAALCDMWR